MLDGYTDLPHGKVAAVVTYLEMRTPPQLSPAPTMSEFTVRRVANPDLDWYRTLYRVIGEPWLWFSRLRLSDDELRAIIHDPAVDVFTLSHEGVDHGLLEFELRVFRIAHQIEAIGDLARHQRHAVARRERGAKL